MQWAVSAPIPLRYGTAASTRLTAQVHTIIRRTISPYYINQAVKRGVERQKVQAGSIAFVQRFGSALNLNVHYHVIFLEGAYLKRSADGLEARFVAIDPPSDADMTKIVEQISHRVICQLRKLFI